MIQSIRIKNFKGWRDSGDVRFAPITVLFGTNSAGKTSIPQLLLLLKQTAESPDRNRPLHFGDKDSHVELGNMESILFKHDLESALEFNLLWEPAQPVQIEDSYNDKSYTGSTLEFQATICAEALKKQPFVEQMSYALRNKSSSSLVEIGMTRRADREYDLTWSGPFHPIRRLGRKWPLPPPTHFFGFPDEATAYYQNTASIADLNLEMTRLLERIHYVGPLREYPNRFYQWSGETPQHVGRKGERAIDAILASRGEREFNFKPRERYKPLDQVVAAQLQQMGLIHDFSVRSIAEGHKMYEVCVQTSPYRSEVLLTDVGFGISQVLPVIVENLYVPPRSIIIFEQPEIHLHPAVQAHLADLFIDAIAATERPIGDASKRVPRNIQFIIESHSEHFLRRLQRRIAEEKLRPEDAALYFIDTDRGQSKVRELDVDEYGRIKNWPENFFGDSIGETEAQLEAMFERMRGDSDGK